jgi:hypothetical protein
MRLFRQRKHRENLLQQENEKKPDTRHEKVGPWAGWDSSIAPFFEPLELNDERLMLVKIAFPKRGRPAKLKQKQGQPGR